MRALSLFSGYGGLDLAVERVLGAETVAVADIDKGACKILAHRFPGVPNIGDVSKFDYRTLGDIDVIAGGFPCQDVSHAGRRAGLRRGETRTGLWGEMCRAVEELQPALMVAENVRGLLSAEADSDVEPCPWCMGDQSGSGMRALGAVLADLADIGYDAQWLGLRAADVGAAHGRFRVFIVASPANAGSEHGEQWRIAAPRQAKCGRPLGELAGRGRASAGVALIPTPRATRGGSATESVALLPTPAVNDMGAGKTVEAWDEWTAAMRAKHGNGNGHGASLAIEAQRLLPTPTTTQRGTDANLDTREGARANLHNRVAEMAAAWGDYSAAIERWERVLGRAAPAPTELGKSGGQRLAPRFVEWLMGLPDGWVTDVPNLSRNEQLKALGNGVVPAQAEAAIRSLLSVDTNQERAL